MILTPTELHINCDCGKRHELSTKKIIIAENVLDSLKDEIIKLKIGKRVSVICDSNTYEIMRKYNFDFFQEVVLQAVNLHADEKATSTVVSMLRAPDVLVAFGTGTIHDITRWCASEISIPFVSCPTAASVDGFSSAVSAMTLSGYKKTVQGVAPELVIADLKVISKAPKRLTLSGIADIMGKYIAITDWKIASLLTKEYYCDKIASNTMDATVKVMESIDEISNGDLSGYMDLMYGLLLSGISMQMVKNSRPASGAEHHISHFIEMGLLGENDALHGEKVGVATIMAAKKYIELAKMEKEEVIKCIKPYTFPDASVINEVFGQLSSSILNENDKDCAIHEISDRLVEKWDDIKRIISEIPKVEDLKLNLKRVGGKTSLMDIGVEEKATGTILRFSPLVRNRLTLMRVASGSRLL